MRPAPPRPVQPLEGTLAERLRRLRGAAHDVRPGAHVAVRPIRRPGGLPGPSGDLTLVLLGMPPIVWSGAVLRFTIGADVPLQGQEVLERIAAQLEVAALHGQAVSRQGSLVVVADAATRDRLIHWMASLPAAGRPRVAWLVLNGTVQDLSRAASALRRAVEVTAAGKVVLVLRGPGGPNAATEAHAWASVISNLRHERSVTILRPVDDGYEVLGAGSTPHEHAGEGLSRLPNQPSGVSGPLQVVELDPTASESTSPDDHRERNPWDDLETGPSPRRP